MGTPFTAAPVAAFAERVIATRGPATAEEEAAAACHVEADPVTAAFSALGHDLRTVAGSRVSLLRACASVVPELEVDAAGHVTAARVTPVDLWRFLLPVCQVALTGPRPGGRRFMLGVAGPGASGKSVLAALLQRLIDLCSGGRAKAALCPLDGFHRPNAWLDSHKVPGPDGRPVALRSLKGTPRTFDAAAFVQCVEDAATARELLLPRYDRRIHDPVPDGLRIGPEHGVVIVEGNYLLLDGPPWGRVRGVLDLALFVEVTRDAVREAMVARHIRGGRTPEDAAAHFERVDGPNHDLCAQSAARADLVVRRDAHQAIVGMELPI